MNIETVVVNKQEPHAIMAASNAEIRLRIIHFNDVYELEHLPRLRTLVDMVKSGKVAGGETLPSIKEFPEPALAASALLAPFRPDGLYSRGTALAPRPALRLHHRAAHSPLCPLAITSQLGWVAGWGTPAATATRSTAQRLNGSTTRLQQARFPQTFSFGVWNMYQDKCK